MKIISNLTAITVFPAAWEELRPRDGAPFAHTLETLKAKYQFQNAGQSIASAQIGLMTPLLQGGMLKDGTQNIQINHLDFQPAGVSISSGTTEQTVKISQDLFAFLRTIGFRGPVDMKSRRVIYSSMIVADLGPILGKIFERWAKVKSFIDSLNPEERVEPFGLKFLMYKGSEPLGDRQFFFEQRVPTPPGEHWVFSNGPFDTETHTKILEMIETEFGSS